MVSGSRIVESGVKSLDRTYLERLNRLRNTTLGRRGDMSETIEEPFVCTGHAHLAGEHIRCTSPAHKHPIDTRHRIDLSLSGLLDGTERS
jgi:hypothetical protein